MSAMVETLDAQMTDYNTSDDVFMQTHSDPWIPEDGTMDDDSFHSFSQVYILPFLRLLRGAEGLPHRQM
jgi:hypothetical protein